MDTDVIVIGHILLGGERGSQIGGTVVFSDRKLRSPFRGGVGFAVKWEAEIPSSHA